MKNKLLKILEEREESWKKTKFATGGGACFECSDYEGMYVDLQSHNRQTSIDLLEGVIDMVEGMRTDCYCTETPCNWGREDIHAHNRVLGNLKEDLQEQLELIKEL